MEQLEIKLSLGTTASVNVKGLRSFSSSTAHSSSQTPPDLAHSQMAAGWQRDCCGCGKPLKRRVTEEDTELPQVPGTF